MEQLEVKDLTKRYVAYGNVTNALNSVSLNVKEGEMVAIMGPSGSGKTTMLNILGCLDNPTSGEYKLQGKPVETMNAKELAKIRNQSIGFVFQQFALIAEYSIYENLELPLLYWNLHNKKHKYSKSEMRSKIFNILEALGIKEHYTKYPSQLSGGQQQRVAIARALLVEPDIIIADEPTGALDQKTGAEVMKLLVDVNKKGKTVIIVTHDEKIAAYCNRRIDIMDGKIESDKVLVNS